MDIGMKDTATTTMMLSDDRGLEVDFFQKIFTNPENKNFSVQWSGGADSTFSFWYMAKLMHDYDMKECTLLPVTGYEYIMNYVPYKETEEIYKIIRESFPRANILPRYTYDFMDDLVGEKSKWKYWEHEKPFVKEKYNISWFVNSNCASPLFEKVDWEPRKITEDRKVGKRLLTNTKLKSAWRLVDKKFIAYQYNKFNLMDTIFPLTASCVNPDDNGDPCKCCWWCREKHWAFGYYDRKIK
jgi:hypothetical protein